MIPREFRNIGAVAIHGTNVCSFWRFRVANPITVATISTWNGGTVAGNLDAGLYNADAGITTLTRLSSRRSTRVQ